MEKIKRLWEGIRRPRQKQAPNASAQELLDSLVQLKESFVIFIKSVRRRPDFPSEAAPTARRLPVEVLIAENFVAEVESFIQQEKRRLHRIPTDMRLARESAGLGQQYMDDILTTWKELENVVENRDVTILLLKERSGEIEIQQNPLPAPLLQVFAPDLTPFIRLHPTETQAISGGWSDTFKGYVLQEDQSPILVAIKSCTLIGARFGADRVDAEELHTIAREIKVALGVRHPNILLFMGSTYMPWQVRSPLCLVSPWMRHGDAFTYVGKRNLDAAATIGLLRGVACGLGYLHAHTPPIVHGDIKGQNVLVDEDGTPKLADFGFARYIDLEVVLSTPSAHGGTIPFQAPERLLPDHFNLTTMQSWTPKADVFSFGLTCWQVRRHVTD